ncbi:siderophore ABC transporter substrate-binding protein [Amaricoccus sp.]|uniref:siderophore ABC transporter substrate-binding protein n=1 Tax=Amaricoccus sp. TaxID=1872485 RepID=UPI001B79FBA0|nr:siderophore ABC transporter substrate-binding protein [Amaricoccus sp.]MBP7000711.1 siderophore ABC transporter substrate-binding protein [Amaricoccus sp.]
MTFRFALALALTAFSPAFADTVAIATARGPAELERAPERVVVFDMAALDTLDALGVAPVGAPEKLYVSYLDHVRAAPVGTLFEPDLEAVAALDPDLIVVGARSAAQYDALAQIAPVIDMSVGDDTLLADARARIEAYGALFGREAQAAELAASLDAEIAAAREAVAGHGDALVLMTNGPKISVYGPGSRFGWVHAALDLPAAVPDMTAATHGEAVSFEFVQQADPDWLLVIDRSAAIGESADAARATLDNPLIADTTAWKQGQVVYLDAAPIYVAGGGVRSIAGTLADLSAAFAR